MRVPLSWLRDHVPLPVDVPATEVARRLTRAGLTVETIDAIGSDLTGPLVVAEVISYDEETHRNGKTVRWCQVGVGDGAAHGVLCGARNFGVGDRVVLAQPGAVLPGGFAISARRTYGHVSEGMICSARELGLGEDHTGILVLPPDTPVGADAVAVLDLRDDVLDIAVTSDRGDCWSIRGVAREAAIAFDLTFTDPAGAPMPSAGQGGGWPVRIEDPTGCDRFVAVTVTGLDPHATSPLWLVRRVHRAGMRPISLTVDVTNYVMLELGQPLHAYDRATLTGAIVVRRARPGEKLSTLDGVVRDLAPDDLLITDDSGPIGIAGVMGGAATEISHQTTEIVLEGAHFDPATIARAARRHRLPSEASRRFERGVDSVLALAATRRAAELLARLSGARVEPAATVVGETSRPAAVALRGEHPGRIAGREIETADVLRRLEQVGCAVSGTAVLSVRPPTWRPDLTDPADLVEEVVRLEGYDTVPTRLPVAPAGRGLTEAQRARRRVGRALAAAGYVESPTTVFVGNPVWDAFGLDAEDPRRQALRLANPLSDEEPLLRTTLLPGLLGALRRNVGRGTVDVGLFELGRVFRPRPGQPTMAPRLRVDRRPTDEELATQDAALPDQPWRVAVAVAGERERRGWWGPGRPACWADAVEAARTVAAAVGVSLRVSADEHAPWHPGRCAALRVDDQLVGHAGELHPRTVQALGLPPRTSAMELELDRFGVDALRIAPAPALSTYPVATQDVALVIDEGVPAAEVAEALRAGGGALLEDVRLFDLYVGEQVGAGRRSLAFTLRFRAPDRTLTVEETTAARDAAVSEAQLRTGAVLRSAEASG